MHFPQFGQTITQAEKHLIFGPPTQALLPLKYPEIYDAYKAGIRNNWTPEEIGLNEDRIQYREMTEGVKHQYDLVLSMLTVMDMVVTDSLSDVMGAASAPEFRAWLARQQFDEANHSDSYAYIIDGIGLKQQEVFDRYLTDKTLYAKVEMAEEAVQKLQLAYSTFEAAQQDSNTCTMAAAISTFIEGYAFFPLILEGTWFTMGLKCGTYASQFHGQMRGTADQFAYILRDEQLHTVTGLRALRLIKHEHPEAWTSDVVNYIKKMAEKGIELEREFATNAYHNLPGLPLNDYIEHCQYQCEQWLRQLDISVWPEARPRLKWLTESIETRKETNFFERRVTEYQAGTGLNWED